MDDASAQLSDIAQRLAELAAAAKQLSEQPLFDPETTAIGKDEEEDRAAPAGDQARPRLPSH
jgi:hypothetical protein